MRKLVLFITFSQVFITVGFVYGRNYASQQARFTSPDPIVLTETRITDPQQLNLYSYARTNPLLYIDPLGMDITLTGSATDQDEYKNRLQGKISSFKINVDASGKVGVDGTVDAKKLKGTDKKLFEEITSTDKHVGITLTRNDPTVDFGRFDGGGKQTIDLADIARLDGPNNKGGLSGNDVIAHETYEPYVGLTRNCGYNEAHMNTVSSFPAFGLANRSLANLVDPKTNLVMFQIRHAAINGGPLNNTSTDIYYKLVTPVPPSTNLTLQPGHITNVRVIP